MNDGLLYSSESDFQNKIIKWLNKIEIYNIKQNASGISRVGIPDLILNVRGIFVAIEIKREEGTVSELQKYSIKCINDLNGISIILRPSGFNEFKQIILWFINKKTININDIKRLKNLLCNISKE